MIPLQDKSHNSRFVIKQKLGKKPGNLVMTNSNDKNATYNTFVEHTVKSQKIVLGT
jgi:hypothetical protein